MGKGGEDGETVNYDEAVEGVEKAENPEESADFDFEELMESIQEEREERREQVSYDWCSTVRDAGELYRKTENASDVGEELDLSENDTEEAITVYRLIFEAPADVAIKASRPGRAYFSLENSVEEAIDQDEDEPLEDLVREYVGGIYLEHNVEQEPVDEPPQGSTPNLSISDQEMKESLSGILSASQYPILGMRMNMVEMVPDVNDMISPEKFIAPGLAGLSNQLQPLQETRISLMASSLANLFGLSNQLQHSLGHQLQPTQQALNSFKSPALTDLAAEMKTSRTMMESIALGRFSNIVDNIKIPDPVIADLSTMSASAAVASVNAHQTPESPSPVSSLSSRTVSEEEVIEETPLTSSPTSHEITTIDSILPDPDQITADLVYEIPSFVAENILTTGDTWRWFTQLDRVHQNTIVSLILYATTLYLTTNPYLASVSVIIAPTLRKTIVERQGFM